MKLEEKLAELEEMILQNNDPIAEQLRRALVALEFYSRLRNDTWASGGLEGDEEGYCADQGTKAREALREILENG